MSELPPGAGDPHGHLLLEPNNFGQDTGDDRILPAFTPPAEQPHHRPAHALAATLAHRRRSSEWRWLDIYLEPVSTSEAEETGEDDAADAPGEALPVGNAPVQRPLRRVRRELRRRPAVLVGGVSALAMASLMGLGIAGWAAISGQEETPPLAASAGISQVWCPEDGRHTAGPGGTSSGAEVIKAFQHAYYVDRDAEAAVALFSKEADAPPTVHSLSRGIEASRGSDHCLKILPTEKSDTFYVDLSVRSADGSVETYPQVVTVSLDDEVLLEQISPREPE